MTERLHFHFSLSCIGEGNGNPFQCSCQENPRDRGALWAAIYGVTQSRTQLKQLSSSSSMGDQSVKAETGLDMRADCWRTPTLLVVTPLDPRLLVYYLFLCSYYELYRLINGDGNGNPPQYSSLRIPMVRGTWCPWGCKESDTTEHVHTYL